MKTSVQKTKAVVRTNASTNSLDLCAVAVQAMSSMQMESHAVVSVYK